jgi:hypothetical protein
MTRKIIDNLTCRSDEFKNPSYIVQSPFDISYFKDASGLAQMKQVSKLTCLPKTDAGISYNDRKILINIYDYMYYFK